MPGSRRRDPVVTLALAAVSIPFILIVTFFASVPLPATKGQVFDAGDIAIFITALSFGPAVGGLAGGMGSGLSDALNGSIFAPFTLVIKGAEGLVAGYISQRSFRRREPIAWLCGSVIMVTGYFVTETYFIGFVFGNSAAPGLAAAILELPFNIIQVVAGGLIGIPVSRVLRTQLPSVLFSTTRHVGGSSPSSRKD
ncbi:MAG: hypothetical protein AUJ07_00890 [Crenarchaeota archaeon 13_1_40CM_3_53_5]|nr:MAG: hypothetical protein AUJ07_00890 [Crenarchaeota archaeon 13_1_40CM_3_53_5]